MIKIRVLFCILLSTFILLINICSEYVNFPTTINNISLLNGDINLEIVPKNLDHYSCDFSTFLSFSQKI